jgi:hypothetical protein
MSVVSPPLFPPLVRPAPSATPQEAARSRRIVLLIVALVLMSIADLICTLTYLTSFGMAEVNPIARAMLAIGGTRQLILYKAFTMTVSCGCIYFVRSKRRAEFGAWVCVAVLFVLMLHWVQYNKVMDTLSPHFTTIGLPGAISPYDDWILISE